MVICWSFSLGYMMCLYAVKVTGYTLMMFGKLGESFCKLRCWEKILTELLETWIKLVHLQYKQIVLSFQNCTITLYSIQSSVIVIAIPCPCVHTAPTSIFFFLLYFENTLDPFNYLNVCDFFLYNADQDQLHQNFYSTILSTVLICSSYCTH